MAFSFEAWIKNFDKDERKDIVIETGKWLEKYHNIPVVDVLNELTDQSIEIIKKLGIELKNKIYTEYEFDILEGEISDYYIYEGITEKELSCVKSLDGTGVSNKEVEETLKEVDKIVEKHNF